MRKTYRAKGCVLIAAILTLTSPAFAQRTDDRNSTGRVSGPGGDRSAEQGGRRGRRGSRGGGRQNQGPRDGGPEGVFHTEVPDHPFDIILGRPTGTSVTASVLVYRDTDAYIEYGKQKGVYTQKTETVAFQNGTPIELVMDSLLPDTQYVYRFRHREKETFAVSDEYTFHTHRPPGSTFTFAVQADSHLDENTSTDRYIQTLANALADTPDFYIDLGDTFMTDKHRPDYKAALDQYLVQRYYFGLLNHSAPLFFVLGNHDGERGSRLTFNADNMTVWSANTRKQFLPNPFPNDFYSGNIKEEKFVGLVENYYAWEWGDALFVVLDPFWFTRSRSKSDDNYWYMTLGQEQYQWLKTTLENSTSKFKFVFIHNLVGGLDKSGRGGSEAATLFEWGGHNKDGQYAFDDERAGWKTPIHRLLVDNNVSIVFHGHDHLFVKQDLDGIVYQEVPQPSHIKGGSTRNAEPYGYVHGDAVPGSGYMRFKVSPDKVQAEFVQSWLPEEERNGQKNGKIAYSYTISGDREATR